MYWEDDFLENVKRATLRAGITVEAALVVPVVLMVIFLLVSLDFYVHDRTYYTLCAFETALTGNSFRYLSEAEGEQSAREKIGSLQQAHRMPTDLPEGAVKMDGEKTEAEFTGNIYRLWGRGTWKYKVSGSVRRVRPEETIRKIRVAERIFP